MLFNFLAEAEENTTISIEEIVNKVVDWCITKGVKLLIGIAVLLVFFLIVNIIAKSVRKAMRAKHRDETITRLIYNLIKKGVKVLLFILFLGYVGIDTAGIGSIIASCAVAVGLALQGSLANIAGWLIIILMRPFRIGDYIACQGVEGTVDDIHLFHTNLITVDNKVIIVPNGPLANGNIINYSLKNTRRVDLVFQISYSNDVVKAIELIKNISNNHNLILKDPESFVRMGECSSSSINIIGRFWVKTTDYWSVYFDLIADVKKAFDENGIVVPFNQIDVHLDK